MDHSSPVSIVEKVSLYIIFFAVRTKGTPHDLLLSPDVCHLPLFLSLMHQETDPKP
jgi:hypothetical protein